jgi:UDP-N-acetylmuramyl tripeptide synthase
MGLRIEYAQKVNSEKVKTYEELDQAIKKSLSVLKPNETLYILPTYSAMLEVRKILTGKKIL